MQPELKEALTERGLDDSGNKPALVDRLWEAIVLTSDTEVGESAGGNRSKMMLWV